MTGIFSMFKLYSDTVSDLQLQHESMCHSVSLSPPIRNAEGMSHMTLTVQ